jgi:phospholipid/cholesterol/gamma-HCH transport system permease protein
MTEPLPAVARPVEALGEATLRIVESLGRFGAFLGEALTVAATPPFKLVAFLDRIRYIGFRSLLIILLTGAFTGMVLGLQLFLTLSRFGS